MTGRPRTTGEDIDRWLASAEAIFDTTERDLRRLTKLVVLAALVVAVVLFGALLVALWLHDPADPDDVADVVAVSTVLLAITGAGAGVLHRSWVQRQEVHRRRREMHSLVDDVREVYPIVARREHWSPDRYRSVRARLARFPVAAK